MNLFRKRPSQRCPRGHAGGAAFVLLAAAWCPPAGAQEPRHEVFSRAYFGEQPVILYPGDRSTVFDDDGSIDVYLVVPPLRTATPGERIELLVNGRRIARQDGQDFVLRNLRRGMHLLRARIVTAGGATIAESRPVRFYQWHAPEPAARADNGTAGSSGR